MESEEIEIKTGRKQRLSCISRLHHYSTFPTRCNTPSRRDARAPRGPTGNWVVVGIIVVVFFATPSESLSVIDLPATAAHGLREVSWHTAPFWDLPTEPYSVEISNESKWNTLLRETKWIMVPYHYTHTTNNVGLVMLKPLGLDNAKQ